MPLYFLGKFSFAFLVIMWCFATDLQSSRKVFIPYTANSPLGKDNPWNDDDHRQEKKYLPGPITQRTSSDPDRPTGPRLVSTHTTPPPAPPLPCSATSGDPPPFFAAYRSPARLAPILQPCTREFPFLYPIPYQNRSFFVFPSLRIVCSLSVIWSLHFCRKTTISI
jgi:hypothetical protein